MSGDPPYVIIVGGGNVGYYLARHLLEREYEVTLIEKNMARAEWIEQHLGSLNIMVGDGDEFAFLATTGIERAAVLIACTGEDEDNLVVCQIAKFAFHVPRTIARINSPNNVEVIPKLGVDIGVSATELLMGFIEAELGHGELIKAISILASGIFLIDVVIPGDAGAIGREIQDIEFPKGALVVSVVREGAVRFPEPKLTLREGDQLIVHAPSLDPEALRDAVQREGRGVSS